MDMHLKGRLELHRLDFPDPRGSLALRFLEPVLEIRGRGGRLLETEASLSKDMGHWVYISLDDRGRFLGFLPEARTSSTTQAFLRGLLPRFQVARPEGGNPEAPWEVEEQDDSGPFLARYELQAERGESGCLKVQKSKKTAPEAARGFETKGSPRISRLRSTRAIPAVNSEASSRWDLCLDPATWLPVHLEQAETVTMKMGNRLLSRSESTFRLSLQGTQPLARDSQSTLLKELQQRSATGRVLALPAPDPSPDAVWAAGHRGALGTATLQSLLEELDRQRLAGRTDSTELVLKFRALASLQPMTCMALGKILIEAPVDSLAFRVLSKALAEARNPEAQAALAELVRARTEDEKALLRLVPVAGLLPSPTQDMEMALLHVASRATSWMLRSATQLALGNMARQLLTSAPKRSDRIVAGCLANVSEASHAQDLSLALMAVGNSGNPTALPFIRRHLSHASLEVRAVALAALRFQECDEADTLLAAALRTSSQWEERLEAAKALSFRVPTLATLAAQKTVLGEPGNDEVRRAILKSLWGVREQFPEVPALVMTLRTDKSRTIRETVEQLLKDVPASG
jgi:hypothetical protein